jgi:hypothetical protein
MVNDWYPVGVVAGGYRMDGPKATRTDEMGATVLIAGKDLPHQFAEPGPKSDKTPGAVAGADSG